MNILVAVHEHNIGAAAQILLAVENDADAATGKVFQLRGVEHHLLHSLFQKLS